MRAAVICLGFVTAIGSAHAQETTILYSQIPVNIRSEVDRVRGECREALSNSDEKMDLNSDMDGIEIGYLLSPNRKSILVDYSKICGPTFQSAGVNCSNRGCDLKIWQDRGDGRFAKVYDDHLYSRYILYRFTQNGRAEIKRMTISIWAGDPRCRPQKDAEFTSGKSCDLDARWINGKWSYELIP
jgi:hypothetical protein